MNTTSAIIAGNNYDNSNGASAATTTGDECALYFMSFVLDTTVGLLIIWTLLRLTARGAAWAAASRREGDSGWEAIIQHGYEWIYSHFICYSFVLTNALWLFCVVLLLIVTTG